jgi:hypothetical protein
MGIPLSLELAADVGNDIFEVAEVAGGEAKLSL